VIDLEGINDVGQTSGLAAQQLENGDRQLIREAHAAGIKIQLGTLTPSGGTTIATYGDAAANQLRQQVNRWIRSQRLSDGAVDFDAAVRDPADVSRIDPPDDGSDHLHFSFAGYQAMANASISNSSACLHAHSPSCTSASAPEPLRRGNG
jgi:lysophospholipase L1-like esterase